MPDLCAASLPLTNLGENIVNDDALFCQWPEVDAIIGNPPFQSKNKMQQELGPDYVNRVRAAYPGVPGRADFCVYWFRRAHDELPEGGRAGLVGTNTIRQNYSREGGLDYIVGNGGTITEAVSSQVWSGEAAVHVSIVNWVKGEVEGKRRLMIQLGDSRSSPWEKVWVGRINSSLSLRTDVTRAQVLECNKAVKACYQGQTHGHKAFLLTRRERESILAKSPGEAEVIFPYLTANDLFTTNPPGPKRFVIDLHPRDVLEAGRFKRCFERLRENVLPDRERAAEDERKRNDEALRDNPGARVNRHHQNFLSKWWLLSYPRQELINKIGCAERYIACAQVMKRPIFGFVSSNIRPNAALMVFTLEDDYSYGVLQSLVHWEWFTAKCSTLKGDFRYTADTVFDTFPWPQNPSRQSLQAVANAGRALRDFRAATMERLGWSLRELYRSLDVPGDNPLKDHHAALDSAVLDAYGISPDEDILAALLDLNLELAERERRGEPSNGPGLPSWVDDPATFISGDCLSVSR